MSDHNINVSFSADAVNSQAYGEGGSYNQHLNNILTQLLEAINKLNVNINNIKSKEPKKPTESYDPSKAIATSIGTAVAGVLTATLKRLLDTQANAIFARASSSGQFMASAIKGGANENFGTYASSLFQYEKVRQQQNVSSRVSAVLGIGGALIGGAAGAVLGSALPGIGTAAVGAKGAAAGAALGTAAGAYLAPKLGENILSVEERSKIEKELAVKGALAERDAMASVSQWKTGFSRFGLQKTNSEIVSGNFTDNGKPINVPLSREFQNQYGKSQNFDAIQNQIAPYLQTNPLDKMNTGDLDKVAQDFLKAGFAVEEFSKLTILGTRQQAMIGGNLNKFAEDVKAVRSKFGDVFNTEDIERSLNLRAMGYGKERADELTFQAKYNPQSMSAIDQFASSTVKDWYMNKAIGDQLGIDVNKSLAGGAIVETRAGSANRLRRQLADRKTGEAPPQLELMLAEMFVGDHKLLGGLLQPKVKALESAVNETTTLSPAQNQATTEIMDVLKNGFANVKDMTVTAQNVIVQQAGAGMIGNYVPPANVNRNNSPARMQ